MTNSNIGIRPISSALAVEIGTIDLAELMSEQTFLAIRTALYDNLVIFSHDQSITPEQQLDFARSFGPIETHAYAKGLDGIPKFYRS